MSSTPAHDAHAPENTLANRYGVAHRRASRRHLRMALGAPALAVAVALVLLRFRANFVVVVVVAAAVAAVLRATTALG